METTPITFLSSDGVTAIHGLIWEPNSKPRQPKGIVQIAHGMAEHKERYEDFGRYLTQQGYVVAIHDHIGHGESISDEVPLGHIPLKPATDTAPEGRRLPRNGAQILVEDVHSLRLLVQKRYSDRTPYFLFGHSMGSFVTRAYIMRYGKGMAGAIICGTGTTPGAVASMGKGLSLLLAKTKGATSMSPLLDDMSLGAYSKAIPDARTPQDWLGTQPDHVQRYIDDPLCGFSFTVGGYAALTGVTGEACKRLKSTGVPSDMPLLFISGQDDPVGGKQADGVSKAINNYHLAGCRFIESHIYEGLRHEILLEPQHQVVYDDVLAWLRKYGK